MQRSQQLSRAVVAPEGGALPFQPVAALLLAGLTTTLVAALSGLVVRFVPAWQPGYLIAAVFLIAVEAALVRYRMLRGKHLEVGALRYLAAEIFLLIMLMRVVATLSLDFTDPAATIARWLRSPLAAFDNLFLLCMLVGLGSALLVRLGLQAMAEIAPRPVAPATDDTIEAAFFRADLGAQQKAAFNRLSTALAWGGGITLLALIGQVANFGPFGGPTREPAPAFSLAGIGYLFCALLLYSQARLTLMRSRWQNDGAEVDPAILRCWPAASVALVLAVGLGALALPRSYGMGMLDALRYGVLVLANIFTTLFTYIGLMLFGVMGLLLTIPAAVLAFIALLLGPLEAREPAPPLTLPEAPPQPPPTEPAALGPGVVFWICMALLTGYALLIVLRRQAWAVALWQRVRSGPLERLLERVRGFWARTRAYAHLVSEAIVHRSDTTPGAAAPLERLRPRLRGMNPPELVRALYRATLERAEQRGMGRRNAQTPNEYAADLAERLPDAAEDLATLTDAYVRAAYAPHPISREEAARVRRPFARLRRRLRK